MDIICYAVIFILIAQCLCDDWTVPCNKTHCTCKWMSGKKSALCNNADHSRVPTTLSTDLQILFLNENKINGLSREEFYRNGLEHLQRIYLKNSFVTTVHKDAFKNLKILVEIDLSENRIERIDRETFTGNERLRILYLYGNPIKRLLSDQFPYLPHLRTLDLHDCQIMEVDQTAFRHLDQLEFLSVKNNSIPFLHPTTFTHMQSSLKTLILDENPWNCDCKLRKFRNWYLSANPNNKKLLCKLPARFENKHWDAIEESQFGCLPTVELITDHNVQTEEVGITNVSFHCLVAGDPKPEVIWELNSNPLPDGFNLVTDATSPIDGDGSNASEERAGSAWSNLTIVNVTSFDSGTYSCRAVNLIGDVSRNATLFLPEVVERVIVKTHETFWYFGLIIGTFGTIFSLIFISVAVCYCRKAAIMRNARKNNKGGKVGGGGGGGGRGAGSGNRSLGQMGGGGGGSRNGSRIKGSVSFNDQEKKLLDLSLTTTTTNDRQDSCELVNTPSTTTTLNNTLSTASNHNNSPYTNTYSSSSNNCGSRSNNNGKLDSVDSLPAQQQISIEKNAKTDEFPLNVSQFPPPPAEFSCSISSGNASQSFNNTVVGNNGVAAAPHLYATTAPVTGSPYQQQHLHHPAVAQFPPHHHPGYGNIFIAVSMGQEALDNADLNMYPDLLNIPSRIKSMDNGCGGGAGLAKSLNNPPSNIIIFNNGGGQAVQSDQPKRYDAHKYKFANGCSNVGYCGVDRDRGTSSIVGLGGISSLLSPPLPSQDQPPSNMNSCPFATLPRHSRHHHASFSPVVAQGTSNCLISPISSTTAASSGQMSPLMMKNGSGQSNPIKIKDMPPTIHEHDIIRYGTTMDNCSPTTATTTTNSFECASVPATVSNFRCSGGGGGGGGAVVVPEDCGIMGLSCPVIQYDNIGRRITASGNSAVKFNEDDEYVIRYGGGGKVRQVYDGIIDSDKLPPNANPPNSSNTVDNNIAIGSEFVTL